MGKRQEGVRIVHTSVCHALETSSLVDLFEFSGFIPPMDLVRELNSFGHSGDLSVRYRNKNIPKQCTDRAEYPRIQILLKGLCRSCFNNSLKSKPKNQAEKWWQTKWDGKEVDASFSTEIQDQSCPLVFKTLLFPLEMDRYSGMSIYARVYKNISPQKGGERKICRIQ